MTFTSAELNSLVGMYFWPLIRILAFLAVSPIFGARFVPARAKIALAAIITLLIAPLIPPVPVVDPISADSFLILLQQIAIGICMAFVLNMLFNIFILGGQIIANKMGLGFAAIVDPQSGVQVPVIGQLYTILITLMFLAVNGHLIVLEVLIDSFTSMPIGTTGISMDTLWTIVNWGTQIFRGALMIALPAVAALLLANIALGVVMRASPVFNIMSIGFPITLTFGFVVMLITIPLLLPFFNRIMSDGFLLINQIVQSN